jgi:oxygen-dependent protoporphyrinogen oxidase
VSEPRSIPKRHIIVVGGGITGLTAAWTLAEEARRAGLPLACTLLEESSLWGGKIRTKRVDDLVLEAGPDSFLSQKPWGLQLCDQLGLTDRLIQTVEAHKKTFVYSRGALRELPEGLVVIVPTKIAPFVRSGILSLPGVARMGMDMLLPARQGGSDESMAAFFSRRLGEEAYERVVEPLMAGIYAGDGRHLSLRATFPRFLDMEREHGSLIRGMLRERGKAQKSAPTGRRAHTMFVTLKGGLAELVEALLVRLRAAGVDARSGTRVHALRAKTRGPARWTYEIGLGEGPTLQADAVILATPAFVTAELVRGLSPGAAELLGMIPHASTATLSLAYKASEVAPWVKGFGFVVPRVEQRAILAATWTSSKWPDRAAASHTLVRCYLGGTGREQVLAGDDAALVRLAKEELRSLTGLTGEPWYQEVNRWERGMPQYTIGHLTRLEEIMQQLKRFDGLYLAGAGYRGIGIPDCIRDGAEAGRSAIQYLQDSGQAV